jgi:hypothetical protein
MPKLIVLKLEFDNNFANPKHYYFQIYSLLRKINKSIPNPVLLFQFSQQPNRK